MLNYETSGFEINMVKYVEATKEERLHQGTPYPNQMPCNHVTA